MLRLVSLFATPWTIYSPPAPLSRGFSRQEYWSCLPFPSPGDLLDSGIKPASPALAGRFFTTEPPGKRVHHLDNRISATSWLQKKKKKRKVHLLLQEMQETWVQSLGWEDPLEEEMATYSSILAWRISWTEEQRITQFSN